MLWTCAHMRVFGYLFAFAHAPLQLHLLLAPVAGVLSGVGYRPKLDQDGIWGECQLNESPYGSMYCDVSENGVRCSHLLKLMVF